MPVSSQFVELRLKIVLVNSFVETFFVICDYVSGRVLKPIKQRFNEQQIYDFSRQKKVSKSNHFSAFNEIL